MSGVWPDFLWVFTQQTLCLDAVGGARKRTVTRKTERKVKKNLLIIIFIVIITAAALACEGKCGRCPDC